MNHQSTAAEQGRSIILLALGEQADHAARLKDSGTPHLATVREWDRREKLSNHMLEGYDFNYTELIQAEDELKRDGLIESEKSIILLTPEGFATYRELTKERAAKLRLEILREVGRAGSLTLRFIDWKDLVGCDYPPSQITRDIFAELSNEGLIENNFYCQRLTAKGIKTYEELCVTVFNVVVRRSFVRDNLLNWVYRHEGTENATMSRWLTSGRERFYGDPISIREIERAGEYLCSREMMKATARKDSFTLRPWRHKLELTVRGVDCVERGMGVADFLNPRPEASRTVYNTYLPNAQGVIVGEQKNFTQTNPRGVDPAKFIQLAGYIGQISGTLGLDDPGRTELERMAEELHAQASSQSPEVGRLRALAQNLKERLAATAITIAAQVGVQMAEDALTSLTR